MGKIIGIDISQLAYKHTGVENYLSNIVLNILKTDRTNEYVLFFSSLRQPVPTFITELLKENKNVELKKFKFPPLVLHYMWNVLHKFPIENFVGNVDVFITSDWTEPPARKTKKATIIYDMIVYKYPKETAEIIVSTQKMKLELVKKESDVVFCISESTKKDVEKILGISSEKLQVIYPGVN